MSMDKLSFSTHLQNKDYDYCVGILRKEIISILSQRVKEKNPEFTYISINSLKYNCFKYLSELEQSISVELYDFSFSENPIEYELSCMMEMYKDLLSSNENFEN